MYRKSTLSKTDVVRSVKELPADRVYILAFVKQIKFDKLTVTRLCLWIFAFKEYCHGLLALFIMQD